MPEFASTTSSTFSVGYKEDWSDIIKDISPKTTPIVSMIMDDTVDSIKYETYGADLYARDGSIDNARKEDVDVADISATDEDLLPMDGYPQIYFEYVKATETAANNKRVGLDDLLDWKGMRLLKHLKQNFETRVLTGVTMRRHAAGTTAGYCMGMPGIIGRYSDPMNSGTEYGTDADNVITSISSFSDASPDAMGSESPSDAQEVLDIVLQQRWDDGGEPDVLVVKSADKRAIAGFDSSGATRQYNERRRVIHNVEFYESPLGEIAVVPSHALQTSADGANDAFDTTTGGTGAQVKDFALLITPELWKTAHMVNENWRSENVPKTGLNYKRYYTAHVGLRCHNPGGDAVFNFTANDGFSNQVALPTTAADYDNTP